MGSPLDSPTPCPDSQGRGQRGREPPAQSRPSVHIGKRAPGSGLCRGGRGAQGGRSGERWQAQGPLCSLEEGSPGDGDGGESLAEEAALRKSSECPGVAWPAALPHLTTPCPAPSPSLQLSPQTQTLQLVPTPGPLHGSSLFSVLAQLFLLGPWGAAHLASFYGKVSLGRCLISPRALELACLDLSPAPPAVRLCASLSLLVR